MKKFLLIGFVVTGMVIAAGCGNNHRTPGRVYMPDMAYSRAYETYADHTFLEKDGIHYNAKPVPGTIARGDLPAFPVEMDKAGDSSNYSTAKSVVSPLSSGMTAADKKEAERLYLVNCGICHGPKLDGNGPLWKDGTGPYTSAPKNLVDDAIVSKLPEGQLFYTVTYGKNAMGSYASQLSTRQRWMVVAYVKSQQLLKMTPAAGKDSTAAKPDSTATAKK